jgi:kynureninase
VDGVATEASLEARIDARAERLRPHYARFLSGKRDQVLLTAHSHQAWPDVSRDAHLEAWDDAARLVDTKWSHIFGEVLPEFASRTAARLGSARPDDLAVAPNTHELVYRLLSCFPTDARVVTTDREFHSLRRQLNRLEQDDLRVERVSVPEDGALASRVLAEVDRDRTDLVALSMVFFTNAEIVTDLEPLLAGLADRGVPALVDTYHAFNAMELAVDTWPGSVFVTGGGYKYAQTGEGACWLLVPRDAERYRPRHTGWFADFAGLDGPQHVVDYGRGGQRFLGATFDPTGLYRGRAVLRWMDQLGLTPAELRVTSMDQTAYVVALFDRLGLADRGLRLRTPREPARRGAFVSFEHPRAGALRGELMARGVWTDSRDTLLRFGPAPYTTASELRRGLETLAELL